MTGDHESSSADAGQAYIPKGALLPVDVDAATGAVLIKSEPMPKDTPIVRGPDFNYAPFCSPELAAAAGPTTSSPASSAIDLSSLLAAYATTGFQATSLSRAIVEINKMIKWRLSDEPLPEGETEEEQPVKRSTVKCSIMLGFTSNLISSGLREVIRYLCQHKMVDLIVTTCGAIEEDIMKCLTNHYLGDWHLDGRELRTKGRNRIGNLIVPNANYVAFEEWLTPILNDMVTAQEEKGVHWSPRRLTKLLGERVNNPDSFLYWCAKNSIPVFSPAITDGSIGDMIFFHAASGEHAPLRLDIVDDLRELNEFALLADRTGQIILGGGLIKHHICNANLMRNGADYSVYVNTGIEYDGSDAGANPDEALSWGKISLKANPVKVWGEATMIFPLIVAETFVKNHPNAPRK